jgi:glyceraldehyde-3-phosphate dehydrogenase type I
MTCRIGINGCGRTGRTALRHALTLPDVQVVALNDVMDIDDLAYMVKYDSVHGLLGEKIHYTDLTLTIGQLEISYFSLPEPGQIPWGSVDVDVVIESSGMFRSQEKASQHLEAGASKVLISAPSDDAQVTVVPGVNDGAYDRERHDVVSMASCTTNSLAPVAKVLNDRFGVDFMMITTVHAYTASQSLMDKPIRKCRRGRAGALSLIPTSTGASRATERVLPELSGKIEGMAIRVPVPDGSVTDIVAGIQRKVTAEEINASLRSASREPPLDGVMTVTKDEVVSVDIVGDPHSAIIDGPSTRVLDGRVAKILSWYDNEWGYSRRLAEFASRLV